MAAPGPLGALVGGACFICPGLVLILALAALFLARHPPGWLLGAAAGAGSAVAAVAVSAAMGLVPTSWRRIGPARPERARWAAYALAGGTAAATVGAYLVLVLLAAGLVEVAWRLPRRGPGPGAHGFVVAPLFGAVAAAGGLGALSWVALKVGALSYGGGFVIVPLMQGDAVHTYHWMTNGQFLNAVALGQVTPGPVVLTVAVVGYACDHLRGGLLATFVAFSPSFLFVLLGAPYFDRIRSNTRIQAFLTGAGPAAIGAIAGSAIPLGLALSDLWQAGLLAAAFVWLVLLRRNVVIGLLGAGLVGVIASLVGLPVS